MSDLFNASSLAQFVDGLKQEKGDSDASLAEKIGISAATVYRLRTGGVADDATLEKIADFAGVSRDWIYRLAKNIPITDGRLSPAVQLMAELVNNLPDYLQEAFLVQARAFTEIMKKRGQ